MFWNLWCERVKFLCPDDKGGSSLTETSVASSTSASSLCVAKTTFSKDKIWQFYGKEKDKVDKTVRLFATNSLPMELLRCIFFLTRTLFNRIILLNGLTKICSLVINGK